MRSVWALIPLDFFNLAMVFYKLNILKYMIRIRFILMLLFLQMVLIPYTQAQNFNSPVDYLQYIGDQDQVLSTKYLAYMSEVAHGHKARKEEKRRKEVIQSIQETVKLLTRLRPFKGDASLRNAYLDFYKILLAVFTEDFEKIVNMEEISEQSFDGMEAYLLAQEKANEKLSLAAEKIEPVVEQFAANNNIKLISKDSKTAKKMEKMGKVNRYYHTFYLLMFKLNKQEAYIFKAFENLDINAAEQNKNAMLSLVEESLEALDTLKSFEGDASLINNCRRVVQYYQNQLRTTLSEIIDIIIRMEDFNAYKKKFDSKPANQRSREEVNRYNEGVNEFNKDVNLYNKKNAELNQAETKVLNGWDIAVNRFFEIHAPRK